ncbi:DegT/DnrJ/EryC1/StrS family aminotransferase [Rhodanobacter terrae]|uniref:DegT/DnrJ/EryC1/StrS family aminotransferase n=1 Tax=Rhodanobacter terrae TaxID=418647 RepID=A0ABW0SRM3_9GAMM
MPPNHRHGFPGKMITNSNYAFPLVDSSYDNQEILRCMETLLSGQLTMGQRVHDFELAFAKHIGTNYAVMVNSGSSANLLATSAIINPLRSKRLNMGDYVAVPAVCWSTSIWPIVQLGLKPVLVDVDPATLNLSIDSLLEAIVRFPIKAVLMVHVLGNSTDMSKLLDIVEKNSLLLIEDTCESLGSTFEGKSLGTLSDFGTYSFYFSHHMTTIEGGMVVAKNLEDYDLLRCLRAHGWSREQSNRTELEAMNPAIDPRFLFVNVGYNVRPMEIQAAFGLEQLRRLDEMNAYRKQNALLMRQSFEHNPKWHSQLQFPSSPLGVDACWFGFPFLINPKITMDYKRFTQLLMDARIDTRPIVSGNMDLQPAVRLFDIERSLAPFTGAQQVHDRGVFIGVHAKPIEPGRMAWLAESVLDAIAVTSQ